ncbi:pathogenesis related protein [Stemphylium lycopersici]|uniref:Pathogenesis related protein n=1 Tax=Stemphylium lycopersici TaxID=183478 RepID=A0A364N3H3_STELY|nr:pathogenesis related protein [Stemphylium lycopersici]RAR05314.1 pathogenesis related protein [Stemphylium lycopersici]RAR10814.1 pathogenesis related protein [Stemphylium lycopersici]
MKLVSTILLTTQIVGIALGCTQYKIGYKSKSTACELDGNTWRNHCRDLLFQYTQYTEQHDGRLGKDMTQDVSCDPCDWKNQHCYCTVSFWRFREWLGTEIPTMKHDSWVLDGNNPAGQIGSKTVDCD